jgi:hypothetical protein
LSRPRAAAPRYNFVVKRAWMLALVAACGGEAPPPAHVDSPGGGPMTSSAPAAYQERWGGLSVRRGSDLVDASSEEVALVRQYPTWPSKGAEVDHLRLTLMTAKTEVAVGESIRVAHVLDVSAPGRNVYIMGPKRPAGEYVDGKLATRPPEVASYPWLAEYDGVTLPSPAIDYNYEITTYHFDTPGTHTIEWRLGAVTSNVITLLVR